MCRYFDFHNRIYGEHRARLEADPKAQPHPWLEFVKFDP